jgi:ribosomal protein S18 acetylase RimI-like enzyme
MDGSTRADVIVDRLHPDEIESGARLLATSFVDEPLFAYIFEGKDPGRVERAVTSWFRSWIRSFIQQGEIHAARVDGTLVGVGVRVPPGGYPLRGTQKALFMLGLMRGVARMSATSRRALKMPSFGSELDRLEPHEPFWYLVWVGVSPELQGRGVGSALANEIVQLIDSRPAPGWFVTFGPQTRALYDRRGFEVEHEVRPFPEGPIGWTMRREPSRT